MVKVQLVAREADSDLCPLNEASWSEIGGSF